MTLQVN